MVLPLWRSLHSINLMLPKEDRRAMLLRIFNDSTPVVNTTQKRTAAATNTSTAAVEAIATEEEAIKEENVVIGQDEQDHMDTKETYTQANEEEDRFNTTV
jgi:multisite-specific tRNA:(cytosine-C5)-methyltransferase